MKHVLFTLVGALAVCFSAAAQEPTPESTEKSILLSPVVLQIPSETSMGAVWQIAGPAAGFVEYSEKSDLSDAQKAWAAIPPLRSIEEEVLSVRIKNLKPNTTYYYRAGTIPVTYPNAYNIKTGKTQYSPVSHFTTMGEKASSSFAVINDTHQNRKTFDALCKKLNELNDAVLIWNGDTGESKDVASAAEYLLNPSDEPYAVSRPILFVNGNHDFRGYGARKIDQVMIKRNWEERDSQFWALGRNFALRQGDIALIGMDTGEDKPDAHPVFQGLAEFEPYRKLETQWLKETLERPEIKSAPYIVLFCHIPLFDKNAGANPGDQMTGYALWQRPCAQMWAPLLKEHNVQTVICGHMHEFRVDRPDSKRPWTQIVGGGHSPQSPTTIIEGKVENGKLVVRVHNAYTNQIIQQLEFEPRSVK